MDTLRGLKVFRDDPEWTSKMLVASVLLLSGMVVPIIGQVVVYGWLSLMVRGLVRGRPVSWSPPLRFDFDYLGKLFGPGTSTQDIIQYIRNVASKESEEPVM